mgnify:CR=1 FL=1
MKLYISSILILITLLLISSCSEVKDNITPSPTIGVHPDGFGDASSPNFHKFVFRENDWSFNLRECQSCHAADYSGGYTDQGCLGCHSQPSGPETCNTCHGVFANPEFIAPPNDLEDNFESSARGVGAHYKHVYDSTTVSTNIGCFECHQVTTGDDLFVHEHISPPPAKMEFGEFSYPDSLNVTPTWNNDLTCSNTYCHGAFIFKKEYSENPWAYDQDSIVGNNYSPIWNSTTETEAECGTCHGQEINGQITPLPKGHFGSYMKEGCSGCHSSVVNSNGEIIDKMKHINKQIDR